VNKAVHPEIPGLIFQKDLGSGGFADVYLYRRLSPDRLVAVKVLRTTDMSDRLVKRFTAEADAMAALNHPHIAQVFSAGITTDGRPYIEMAYYPYGSLEDKVRQAPFSVPDVLRIGVQLCSAIETAHRLHPPLLHRDIKPANVLIDEYGDPVLTDFGIASRMNETNEEDASLSVFWAPPEAMFSTSPIDRRSDVYSLGALLWHLLVGRAPYVIPGGDNRPAPTMIRTRDLPIPSTGRPEVPASLERLLNQTMSKDPRLRPATAADLARALNAIEQNEFGFGRVTPFKVKMDPASQMPDVNPLDARTADLTKFKAMPQVVRPQVTLPPAPPLAPITEAATMLRGGPALVDAPVEPAGVPNPPSQPPRHGSKVGLIIGLAVVLAALIAGGLWLALKTPSAPPTTAYSTPPRQSADIGADLPPGDVTIACTRQDTTVDCTWSYANDLTTDAYRVQLPDGNEVVATTPEYQATAPNDQPYCIKVKVVREDGKFPGDWSDEGCA